MKLLILFVFLYLSSVISIPTSILKRNVKIIIIDKQTPLEYRIINNNVEINVQDKSVISIGSGFILDSNHIITNYHVVNKTNTVRVFSAITL